MRPKEELAQALDDAIGIVGSLHFIGSEAKQAAILQQILTSVIKEVLKPEEKQDGASNP